MNYLVWVTLSDTGDTYNGQDIVFAIENNKCCLFDSEEAHPDK